MGEYFPRKRKASFAGKKEAGKARAKLRRLGKFSGERLTSIDPR
jgi:hypothetical protein